MTRLWTPNRPPIYMAPYGALVAACRPKGQAKPASSLLTGLVAYWKLEEASGTRVDATSRGNDLTDNNTVGQAAGKVGNAASFVAANSESLSILDNADLSMGDVDFTIAAWVQLTTLPATNMQLIAKDDGGGAANLDYAVSWRTTNVVTFFVSDGASVGSVSATTFGVWVAGVWHYVLAQHDSSNNQLGVTIDNGSMDTAAWTTGVQDGVPAFALGAFAGGEYLNGLIDEVGIWKRVLTAAERTALYNGGSGITHPFTGT